MCEHLVPGIGEFCAAIKTDLIGVLLNSKYPADFMVMAPEQPTEKRFHMVRDLNGSTHNKMTKIESWV
ncbi:hypothetical protein SBA5_880039 [Candidatus Sulfotelmatomonas gaucii]|uniref:Uncharacterized protein n=1 Tax=Candidatus Sulfuritelmatomonas gaucii TaxID=2043161 RepID=A0A2N9M7C8_9BACT|nr:hypothetical protein SBA5_880039 [Candidatus Sulfotelmatomonas gaucii]